MTIGQEKKRGRKASRPMPCISVNHAVRPMSVSVHSRPRAPRINVPQTFENGTCTAPCCDCAAFDGFGTGLLV